MSAGVRATPPGDPSGTDDTTRISAIAAGVLGVAFTVAGFALGGPRTGLSIAIGAGIAVGNLLTMRAIIGALLTPDDEEPGAASSDAPGASGGEADGTPLAERALASDPVAEAEAEGAAQAAADPSLDGDRGDGDAAAEARAKAEADAAKRQGKRGGAAWGVFAVLKIFVLFGAIGLLLMRGWVEAIPLVIGYGVLPLGITASTLVSALRPKRRR